MSETRILREVLVAITALPGICVFRHNTGMLPTPDGRVMRFGLPGSADIIGAYRRVPVAIECKTERGRQSPQQRRFQAAWERAGGVYVLARSADDALAALAAIA